VKLEQKIGSATPPHEGCVVVERGVLVAGMDCVGLLDGDGVNGLGVGDRDDDAVG